MCQCRGSLIKQTNVNIPVRRMSLLIGTYIHPECFPVFHLVFLKSKQDTKQENDLKKASENNQSESKTAHVSVDIGVTLCQPRMNPSLLTHHPK